MMNERRGRERDELIAYHYKTFEFPLAAREEAVLLPIWLLSICYPSTDYDITQ